MHRLDKAQTRLFFFSCFTKKQSGLKKIHKNLSFPSKDHLWSSLSTWITQLSHMTTCHLIFLAGLLALSLGIDNPSQDSKLEEWEHLSRACNYKSNSNAFLHMCNTTVVHWSRMERCGVSLGLALAHHVPRWVDATGIRMQVSSHLHLREQSSSRLAHQSETQIFIWQPI